MSLLTGLVSMLFVWGLLNGCEPVDQTATPQRGGGASDNPAGNGDEREGPGDGGSSIENEDLEAAESFFELQIRPAFRSATNPRCLDCHASPRDVLGNPDAADQAIYDFARMYRLLRDGSSFNENALFQYLIGTVFHPGQRICTTEQDPLCALVVEWWMTAFADSDVTGKYGEIGVVSTRGQVSGWAMDPGGNAEPVTIRLYFNGDNEDGMLLTEQVANRNYFINGSQRPHGFIFQLPGEVIDNNEHQLWAYAVVGDEEIPLSGNPFQYQSYAPRGLAVVGNNYPGDPNCAGCHIFNYETLYGNLITPAPNEGGTATNNRLYNKVSGREPHGGPNGGFPSAASVQRWWNCEFANNCQ